MSRARRDATARKRAALSLVRLVCKLKGWRFRKSEVVKPSEFSRELTWGDLKRTSFHRLMHM